MPTHKTEKVLRISEFNLTKTNIITDVHIFVQNNHPHQPNGSCEQYINLAFDNQVHTIEFSRTRHPPYTTHHRPSEKLIFNLTGSSALRIMFLKSFEALHHITSDELKQLAALGDFHRQIRFPRSCQRELTIGRIRPHPQTQPPPGRVEIWSPTTDGIGPQLS